MVVFVDLEDDVPDDPYADPNQPRAFSSLRKPYFTDKVTVAKGTANSEDENVKERPNPNINSFSAALGAYPYVWPMNATPGLVSRLTEHPASSLD